MQTALVLVLIALAVIASARTMSNNAASDMEITAEGVGDPSKLTERFAD